MKSIDIWSQALNGYPNSDEIKREIAIVQFAKAVKEIRAEVYRHVADEVYKHDLTPTQVYDKYHEEASRLEKP